jgi:hypothetical protein
VQKHRITLNSGTGCDSARYPISMDRRSRLWSRSWLVVGSIIFVDSAEIVNLMNVLQLT